MSRVLDFLRIYWKSFLIVATPVILSPIIVVSQGEQTEEALKCAYLILLMAIYWLTEALPLPVTSMIPMIALPLLGLMSTSQVAINYLNSTNYMFFGGLIMAIAVEHCGLHMRVALKIIMMVGTSQARLMLGFMFTTMFISMWISNTATTAMMLPIVDAVSAAINQKAEEEDSQLKTQSSVVEVSADKELTNQSGEKFLNKTRQLSMAEEDFVKNASTVQFLMGKDEVVTQNGSILSLDDGTELIQDEKDNFLNEESFESKLGKLTHGKINSIGQLMSLTALDDSCGHFDEDMSSFVKGATSPEHESSPQIMKTPQLMRTNTMAKLIHKQGIQKQIRENKSSSSLTNNKSSLSLNPNKSTKELELLIPKEGQIPTCQVAINQPNKDPPEIATKGKEELERNFLLLGIAVAANIGGTGVITGTPPNLVVPDVLQKKFGPDTGLTFASWMAFAIPVMLVNLFLSWLWLQIIQRTYPGGKQGKDEKGMDKKDEAMKAIKKKYTELGRMTCHEIQVLVLFIILILLWFFKTPIFMPGWGDQFEVTSKGGSKISVKSATPAIFTVVMLFILPQNYNFWPFSDGGKAFKNSPALITWRLVETKMCWGVLFLLGGGFALAKALQSSGLSILLVEILNNLNLSSLPPWLACLIFSTITVAITNIASNTATANILVPILAEMALTICINPIYLTLPAAIACSYAFGLPVSTAPNAIVFGHSTMTTGDMAKAGFVINVICVVVLVLGINSYGILLFGLDEFPDWAAKKMDNATACQV